MNLIMEIFKAIGEGIKEGFIDLVKWSKPPRETPKEQEDISWKKYYKYPEWRFWALREVTAQIIVVLVLLILIRETIGEFRFIPSESMEPTMKVGDKLFVEKFSKIFHRGKYQRGDIVIFYPPKEATDDKEVLSYDPFNIFARLSGLPFLPQPEAYIKRIVGIPGDRIKIRKNEGLFIDGVHLFEPYHFASVNYLPEYDMDEITVPKDHYFVLGDNRNFSFDSHYWGFLPKDRIIGRAAFLIYRSLDEKPKLVKIAQH